MAIGNKKEFIIFPNEKNINTESKFDIYNEIIMKLSIIIPCYNEKDTINEVINKINKINIKKQVILVDDCSTDGTIEIIKKNIQNIDKVIFHKKNLGKGGAIKSSKKYITGDYVVIQDADLEYDPEDIVYMFDYIKKNNLKALYGSRVLGRNRYKENNSFTSLFRIFANHVLTIFSNFINKQKLTDAHTCYKMFTRELFDKVELIENDFAFCPEITTKVSKLNININEIRISYKGRSYKEGKKIAFKDGFKALYTVIKYSIFKWKRKKK